MCRIQWRKRRGKKARNETADTTVKRRKNGWKDTKERFDKCNEILKEMNILCDKLKGSIVINHDKEFSERMNKGKGKIPEVLLGCKVCQDEKGEQKWCRSKSAHTRHLNQAHPTAKEEDREAIICDKKETVMTLLGIYSIAEEEDEDLENSFMTGITDGSAVPSTQNVTPEVIVIPPTNPSTSTAQGSATTTVSAKKRTLAQRQAEDSEEDEFQADSIFEKIAGTEASAKKPKADDSLIDNEALNSIKDSKKKMHDVSVFFNQVRSKLNDEDGSVFQSEVDSFSAGLDSMYEDLENKYKDVVKSRDDKQMILESTLGELQTVKANLKITEHARDRLREQLDEKAKLLAEINEALNVEAGKKTGTNNPKVDIVSYVSKQRRELDKAKSESEIHRKWGEQQKRLADGVQQTLNLLQQNKDELAKELKDLKKRFPCEKQKNGECLLNEKSCEYMHRPPKGEQDCNYERWNGKCRREGCEFRHKNTSKNGTINESSRFEDITDQTDVQDNQLLNQFQNTNQFNAQTPQNLQTGPVAPVMINNGQFVQPGIMQQPSIIQQPFQTQGGGGTANLNPPVSNIGGNQKTNMNPPRNPSQEQKSESTNKIYQKKKLRKEVAQRKKQNLPNQKGQNNQDPPNPQNQQNMQYQQNPQNQGNSQQPGTLMMQNQGQGQMVMQNPQQGQMIMQNPQQMGYQQPLMMMNQMNPMMQQVQFQQPQMMQMPNQNQMQQAQLLQAQLNSIQATLNGGQMMRQ